MKIERITNSASQRKFSILSKKDLGLFVKAFRYVKPHRWLFIAVICLILVALVIQLYQPLLYGQVIDQILAKNLHKIVQTLLLILVLTILNAGVGLLQGYLADILGNKIILDIKQDLYDRIIDMPVKVLDSLRVGEIISRLEGDAGVLTNIITFRTVMVVLDVLKIFGIGFIVFRLNILLSLIIVAMFPLTYLLMYFFSRVIRKKNRELREMNDNYYSFITESVSGLKEIKALNIQKLIKERFREWTRQIFQFRINTDLLGSLTSFSAQSLTSLTRLLVMGVGSYQIIAGNFTMGGFVAFNSYSEEFNTSLGQTARLNVTLQQAVVSLERIFLIRDSLREGSESIEGDTPVVEGKLSFEDVCFGYLPGQTVLKKLSFTIRPGQITALVGASGSGKTTMFNLLMRFYEPDCGRITVDGLDLKCIKIDYWRDKVGIVTQEPFLFNLSIKENLLLAKRGASQNEIEEAAKKAFIHHFITSLPDSYDTVIGERGARLSGGQKQRLAIARAVLKGAQILLFDEATSALDGESEECITKTLENLSAEHTVIVIAHRLSTVRNAAQIVVLDNGEVVGIGRHEELIEKNPAYQRLYKSQVHK